MKLLDKKIFIWLMVETKRIMILVTKLVQLLKKLGIGHQIRLMEQ